MKEIPGKIFFELLDTRESSARTHDSLPTYNRKDVDDIDVVVENDFK